MADSLDVTGRVVAVRPRSDGSYGVTLGPGPDVYWYTSEAPPMLGAEVNVLAASYAQREVGHGRRGSVTVLLDTHPTVLPTKPVRVVAPEWHGRAADAMMRPLRPYQVEGAAWVAARLAEGCGAILADEPGLGKSAQTIAALVATGLFPAIVVCPTSLKTNWAREFAWASRAVSIEILHRRRGPIAGADVTILNPSLLRYREEQLGALGARAFVLDEAHSYKEPRSPTMHRASVARRLAIWIGRTVLLSGTPILNRIQEMWSLLNMADPGEWRSYDEFRDRYCRALTDEEEAVEQKPVQRIVTSAGRVERVDELQVRAAPCMLRRLKEEVATELPPRSRQSVLVEIDEHDMREYRAAEQNIIAWLKHQGSLGMADRALKAQALVKLTYLRRIAAIGKLRWAIPEYLRQWFDRTTVAPLVLFAHHVDIVEGLYRTCESIGVRTVRVRSSDSDVQRDKAVDGFQSGHYDAFVAPILCMGMGVNLHHASDVMFAERMWVPNILVQAEDRVHRIGQTRPVTATYVDAAGTIDEYMAASLDAKYELISGVIDPEANREHGFRIVTEVAERYANGPQ